MLSSLRRLFLPSQPPEAIAAYIALVAQARNQFFYESMGVPDTLDGRFELLLLHVFLMQHRMKSEPTKAAENFSRALGELFFADMDRSLREIGVADTGVRYRIKAMAKAYHGRMQVYTAALADREALKTALARNLYGTVAEGSPELLTAAAEYTATTHHQLAKTGAALLLSGNYQWPAPSGTAARNAA